MDKTDRRRLILKTLKNTLIRVAEKGQLIIVKDKLIKEMCTMYDISTRMARDYIKEMVDMGTAKQDDEHIWHGEDQMIRYEYLINKKD